MSNVKPIIGLDLQCDGTLYTVVVNGTELPGKKYMGTQKPFPMFDKHCTIIAPSPPFPPFLTHRRLPTKLSA